MPRCKKCNEWRWENHECSPEFKVFHENVEFKVFHENVDDYRTIYACNKQEAAEIYAEWIDKKSVEYLIAGGQDITIEVEDQEGVRKKFCVEGRAVPEYAATEIKE